MTKKVSKSDSEWREQLTSEQYNIARKKGTERAFSGAYWDDHDDRHLSLRRLRRAAVQFARTNSIPALGGRASGSRRGMGKGGDRDRSDSGDDTYRSDVRASANLISAMSSPTGRSRPVCATASIPPPCRSRKPTRPGIRPLTVVR